MLWLRRGPDTFLPGLVCMDCITVGVTDSCKLQSINDCVRGHYAGSSNSMLSQCQCGTAHQQRTEHSMHSSWTGLSRADVA